MTRTDSPFRYGADDIVADQSPISLFQMATTDEILRLAEQQNKPVRPVRAKLQCNQIRWQDQRKCDWRMWIEARSDQIEERSNFLIYQHLQSEHRGLESRVMHTQTTVEDF